MFALSLDSSFSVVFFDDSMKIFVFSFSLCVFVYVYVVCVFVEIRASRRFVVFADLVVGVLVLVVVQKVNVVSLRCLLVVSDGTKENLEELKGREGERRRSMIAKTSTAPLYSRDLLLLLLNRCRFKMMVRCASELVCSFAACVCLRNETRF